MAKVIYATTTYDKAFGSVCVGQFFIYKDQLFLKISIGETRNAFNFETGIVTTFARGAIVLPKNGNDIEITVK